MRNVSGKDKLRGSPPGGAAKTPATRAPKKIDAAQSSRLFRELFGGRRAPTSLEEMPPRVLPCTPAIPFPDDMRLVRGNDGGVQFIDHTD
jgi:hypothetical protein